jgi:NADPH:quinone reductase-like Zn-dependent oxidoreductase
MSAPIFPSPGSLDAELMRAATYTRFGPPEVLVVRTLVKPVPKADEIRVRTCATTVTAACTLMRRGDTLMARVVLGFFGPRKRFQVPGIEFAGIVEAVGSSVLEWRPGDRVFGFAGYRAGAYAQCFCLRASASLAKMPEGLDFAEAASLVDGPTTALYFLQHLAQVKPGERVLVVGASGSVGGAAVQVAKSLGAIVTGVCSTANLDLVRSLGADNVIDYTLEDFTRSGPRYDVVFDAVTKSTFAACKPCLRVGGRYLPTVPRLGDYLSMGVTKCFGDRRILCGMSIEKKEALGVVKRLLERGALRPVIDRRYPLEQIALAHGYVDTGRKKGNVVIDMV